MCCRNVFQVLSWRWGRWGMSLGAMGRAAMRVEHQPGTTVPAHWKRRSILNPLPWSCSPANGKGQGLFLCLGSFQRGNSQNSYITKGHLGVQKKKIKVFGWQQNKKKWVVYYTVKPFYRGEMKCCGVHCSADPSITASRRFSRKLRVQLQENTCFSCWSFPGNNLATY